MSLRGVCSVKQGFIKSQYPNDAYSEAVIVNFDTHVIGLTELIEVHLSTHASASQHKMRDKYRSAIYTFDGAQVSKCQEALTRVQHKLEKPLVTKILPHVDFKFSCNKYWNYYFLVCYLFPYIAKCYSAQLLSRRFKIFFTKALLSR